MKKNIVVAFVVCLMAGIAVTACGDIETGIPNGDCFNGEKKNDDNGGNLICKEGKWVKDGAAVGYVCTEENSENSENSEVGKLIKPDGKEEYCIIDGQKVSCKSESECGECLNGSKKPDNYICENGKWVEDKQCQDNETKCNDSKLLKCEQGKWKDTDDTCDNSDCVNDDKQIGKKNGVACKKGEEEVSCKTNKDCGECLNGKPKEANNRKYICENGKWVENGAVVKNVCINEESEEGEIGKIIRQDNKRDDCLSKEGNKVSCKNETECGVCLNGKYKCEVVGNERKVCEHGEWMPSGTCECPNWGDVVNNSACLIYGEDLKWFACSGNMKGQTKFEDKLFCSNNKWYECKSDAHLNAVVGKMACVKIDGVYKWTKCNNTDEAKGRENDDKILCNGMDWIVCEKSETTECVRKNNYGKLYICDGNKWSDKTCDVDCQKCQP